MARICRFTHAGATRLGLVEGPIAPGAGAGTPDLQHAVVVDLGGGLPSDLGLLMASEPDWRLRAAAARDRAEDAFPLGEVKLEAPIARPPKFLAIGLNYADHIAETGADRPNFPVFFNKQSTCVVGPGDAIEIPSVSPMVDYEGELGVVIGRRCRHVSAAAAAAAAADVVAGYLVVNDVSVRDWQFRAPTMTLGKSFDTHGPIGPWVVTADEIPDPHTLSIRTWVTGELLQDGSTSEMLYDIWQQIETLSTVFTLEPGDVIATGTPAGVGVARDPARWLVPGDTVRIEIEAVGALENPVGAA